MHLHIKCKSVRMFQERVHRGVRIRMCVYVISKQIYIVYVHHAHTDTHVCVEYVHALLFFVSLLDTYTHTYVWPCDVSFSADRLARCAFFFLCYTFPKTHIKTMV